MSRGDEGTERVPLIALIHNANRAFQAHMALVAQVRGYEGARMAHNSVYATLGREGARTSDLAERAGITKQSMGEVVRELVDLGILEMRVDPSDKRAKLVTYTDAGLQQALAGRAHLQRLETRFEKEFGTETYLAARKVLVDVLALLNEDSASI